MMALEFGDIQKPQWNLYKTDTIAAWKKCPLYTWRKRSHAIDL